MCILSLNVNRVITYIQIICIEFFSVVENDFVDFHHVYSIVCEMFTLCNRTLEKFVVSENKIKTWKKWNETTSNKKKTEKI